MKFEPLTVRTVADLVGGATTGDETVEVSSVASLEDAGPGDLTFAVDARRAGRLGQCAAAAAMVPMSVESAPMALIRVDDVQAALAALLGGFEQPEDLPPAGVDPTAVVAPDAKVAADAAVGPGVLVGARATVAGGAVLCANVSIGRDAEIGQDTVLLDGVVVRARCRIGRRVRIGPNSVIGHDGFGYYTSDGVHHRIPHVGNVVIEDDVEIGACSCVDRAKFGTTRIGAGTKIDNLVQVAHNVQIGRGCLLAGQVGIAGSTRLGQYVALGGNTGVRDGVTVGDGVRCAACSAIAGDVPDGQVLLGTPARSAAEMLRIIQAWAKLPELIRRVRKLEARLKELEPAEDH